MFKNIKQRLQSKELKIITKWDWNGTKLHLRDIKNIMAEMVLKLN